MAKVQVVGGAIKDSAKQTVGEIKAELGVPNHAATINGEPAGNDDQVGEYDFVSLAPAVKGA